LTIGNRYSFSASIFYLGFIVGSYPAILMAQRWPIERVAAGIVSVWGACLMCTAACTNWQGFYAQRFFLGFLESGVSPMFMLIVGGWYKKQEQALRMGAWYCATGYAAAISPLINYAIGHISGGGLNSWQYMYIVAGAITVVWALVILFFMPPDPIRAKGFNDRERYIAVARMRENNSGVRNTHFKGEQVKEALCDIKFWLIFSISFLMMIANGPVSSFIPIIINGFGFNRLNSLLLTLPAGVIIGTIEWTAPYLAYKFKGIRTWLIVLCQCGTITASAMLWRLPRGEKGGLLFACYILSSFGGGYAVLMGLQIANTAGYTKRSITSSGVFMGYCLGTLRVSPHNRCPLLMHYQATLSGHSSSRQKMHQYMRPGSLQCWQLRSPQQFWPSSTATFVSGIIRSETRPAPWKATIMLTRTIPPIAKIHSSGIPYDLIWDSGDDCEN
jgi:MFS family permease